jgi:hypothetical protein
MFLTFRFSGRHVDFSLLMVTFPNLRRSSILSETIIVHKSTVLAVGILFAIATCMATTILFRVQI